MRFRRRREPLPDLNIDRTADQGVVPLEDDEDPVASAPVSVGYGDGAGGQMNDIITTARIEGAIRRQ